MAVVVVSALLLVGRVDTFNFPESTFSIEGFSSEGSYSILKEGNRENDLAGFKFPSQLPSPSSPPTALPAPPVAPAPRGEDWPLLLLAAATDDFEISGWWWFRIVFVRSSSSPSCFLMLLLLMLALLLLLLLMPAEAAET